MIISDLKRKLLLQLQFFISSLKPVQLYGDGKSSEMIRPVATVLRSALVPLQAQGPLVKHVVSGWYTRYTPFQNLLLQSKREQGGGGSLRC